MSRPLFIDCGREGSQKASKAVAVAVALHVKVSTCKRVMRLRAKPIAELSAAGPAGPWCIPGQEDASSSKAGWESVRQGRRGSRIFSALSFEAPLHRVR